MSGLFSSPPDPQLPPPPPQISNAMVASEQSDNLLRRKMGVGTQVLTSNRGLANLGTTKAASISGS